MADDKKKSDDKMKSEDMVPQADKQGPYGDCRTRGQTRRASPRYQQGRGKKEEGQVASSTGWEACRGRPLSARPAGASGAIGLAASTQH
jgi:hypothetical protein